MLAPSHSIARGERRESTYARRSGKPKTRSPTKTSARNAGLERLNAASPSPGRLRETRAQAGPPLAGTEPACAHGGLWNRSRELPAGELVGTHEANELASPEDADREDPRARSPLVRRIEAERCDRRREPLEH